jgi:hypothetical protein
MNIKKCRAAYVSMVDCRAAWGFLQLGSLPLNIYPCLPGQQLTPCSPNNAKTLQNTASALNIYPCLPGQSPRGRNIYGFYSTWIQAAKFPVLTVYRVGFAYNAQISLVSHSTKAGKPCGGKWDAHSA